MKTKIPVGVRPPEPAQPTEEEIRDYAYHLYVQEGCQDGHDLAHWFEAEACLQQAIPKEEARTRLHRHTLADRTPHVKLVA